MPRPALGGNWRQSIAIGYVITSYVLASYWIANVGLNSFTALAWICAPLAIPLALMFLLACSVLPDGQGLVSVVTKIFVMILAGTAFFAFVGQPLISLFAQQDSRSEHADLCPTCGYDLRATPERCPECGTRRRLRRLL